MRWQPDAQGWIPAAIQRPSPNCDARPPGERPTLLVVHNISLPPGVFGGREVADLFLNLLDCDAHPWFDRLRGLRVSSHLLVLRGGAVLQFVSCHDRAWHAGRSLWAGRERCNDFSVGIELEGTDDEPFTDAQYDRLEALTLGLRRVYPLTAAAGHSDIAPGRKTDPGPFFDWQRFARRTGLPAPADRRA
jgi:AmpD protein